MMPIGIVSDELFQRELDQLSRTPSTPPTTVVIDMPSRGRSDGDVNVPDPLRQIIGETAVIDGPQEAMKIADMFGISRSSVSAYAKGATSTTTYNSPSKSIISHINKSRERAVKRASKTLNAALGAITQDKLDYADATDLSGIAKDMSVIIKNLEPPTPQVTDQPNQPQYVIFAPTFKDERSYDTITVQE
jgi:predicted transcriptional regulator